MKNQWMALTLVLALLGVARMGADEPKLEEAKCIFSGQPCKTEASAEHNGGKVYFCCKSCVAAFKKDPAKHATKANHQLVLTGQAKQVACPFSGKPGEATLKVAGVDVTMCCNNCKGKVEKAATDAEKAELVFSDAAFKKGFKVGDAK